MSFTRPSILLLGLMAAAGSATATEYPIGAPALLHHMEIAAGPVVLDLVNRHQSNSGRGT